MSAIKKDENVKQNSELINYCIFFVNYDRAETQKRQKGKPKNCQKATKSAKSAQNGKFLILQLEHGGASRV